MFGWGQTAWSSREATDETCNEALAPQEGACGIVSGTKVATEFGWRPVEALTEGDLVLTFDSGMQPVVAVERHVIWCEVGASDMESWPLTVPAGVLGNEVEMMLLPDQPVLVESDAAESLYGDPFVLIPARNLAGVAGIDRVVPPVRIEVVTLRFAREQIVFANIGALFLCHGTEADIAAEPRVQDYAVLCARTADLIARDVATPASKPLQPEPRWA